MSDPIKLLNGYLTIEFAVDFIDDFSSPVNGAAKKWAANIFVYPQLLGIPREDYSYQYSANDVNVGDWVASNANGNSLRIDEIVSVTDSIINVILEDVDAYNVQTDDSGMMDGSILPGSCFIFTINDKTGLPILGPLDEDAFSPIIQDNILARFIRDFEVEQGGGGSLYLGTPTDGSFDDGAIDSWVPTVTRTDDAFYDLNFTLGKLTPEKPVKFANYNMTFESGSRLINDFIKNPTVSPENPFEISGLKLTNGSVPNLSGSVISAGDFVHAVPTIVLGNTNTSIPLSYGDRGIVSTSLNGVDRDSITLTKGDDRTIDGGITIEDDFMFNDFWPAITVSTDYEMLDGINKLSLTHSISGTSETFVVVETLNEEPEIENTEFNLIFDSADVIYSSGIPNAPIGATVRVSVNLEKIAGRTYPSTQIFSLGGGPLAKNEPNYWVGAGQHNIPAILDTDHGSLYLANVPFELNDLDITEGTAHSGPLTLTANNALHSKTIETIGNINFIGEISNDIIFENPVGDPEIYVKRILTPTGDRPEMNDIIYDAGFNSQAVLPSHEAVVIGGKLKFDKTDYSTGWFPIGPDYSTKSDTQYACFMLKTITNNLSLIIEGTFSKFYIKLPGIENDMPEALNGWMDATKIADFYPSSWPGAEGVSDGCLVFNQDTQYNITFGSMSSAYSDDNVILLRFELEEGDEITKLYRNSEEN